MKANLIAALVATTTLVCGASAAQKNYLRFTARGGSVSIGMSDFRETIDWEGDFGYVPDEEEMAWYLPPPLTLETATSPDQAEWSPFKAGTDQIALADGETVYFRQHDQNRTNFQELESGETCWHFTMTADPSTPQATVEAGGNAVSVVDATCGEAELAPHAIARLFQDCTILTTPPELHAAKLADYCFQQLFWGCTALRTPPALPMTALAQYCYSGMFRECTALQTAPALPATDLAQGCYSGMFYGCTSLAAAPDLPATSLAKSCYLHMFYGCTSLKRISVALTTWGENNMTDGWMNNVPASGLFIAPASLERTYGKSNIPTGWTAAEPVTVKVPRQANCTATVTADGAAIRGAPDGDAAVFTFGKGEENANIAFQPSDGYALIGAAEYAIAKISAPVTFGTGDYVLPTVVRLAPEVSCQSAALQIDGLAVVDGAVSLSFGVRTTPALEAPDWQPAIVTGATVSPDGKTVTLTIPATAAQGFYTFAGK